ncbi:matrix-remodeling-associated protein 7 [Cavia porcellus]|uniref:Matrix-remodeling-associated protein 7 helical domain-containing protein n=1 Tax=Cavia porcellus TaxID=10141 RepID=A0A286XZ90_CAVPO|nr:matrix-remodeling-associated protein 7 [Cavia porcellus]
MEAPAELLAALPALVTVLAVLFAWLLLRRGAAPEPALPAQATATPTPPSPCAPEPAGPGEPEGPEEPGEPAAALAEAEELTAAEARQEEEQDSGVDKDPASAEPEDEDGEAFSFKYSPGQLRGNQYKKMMTKEELEEEQRVQKEQLAAIFKLMKDHKETFGEMSDGDMQEQLRLYDM